MPTRIDTATGEEYQTIYVKVINPAQVFKKDKLEWPDEKDKEHKDDPPKSFRIDVHGYDPLGRRVCPVFEVPDCQEIQLAIHNEMVRDPETKRVLYSGRLIQVAEKDLENYVQWIDPPTITDMPEVVVAKVINIRKQQIIGDKILGETSRPYSIPKDNSPESIQLRELYSQGIKDGKKELAAV